MRRSLGIWIALSVLLIAGGSRADSVGPRPLRISFSWAARDAGRIVYGKVTARREVKIGAATLHVVDVAIESVLKGPPARPGAHVSVFDHAEWYRQAYAEELRAGRIYRAGLYATPLPDADIKRDAAVLVFLLGGGPPAGFPPDAAFLVCPGAFERGERARDVGKIKTAGLGETVRLAMGEVAKFPAGIEIEAVAHAHKRPMVGGAREEIAELTLVTPGTIGELTLGHVIDADGKETWGKKVAMNGYEVELVGMTYDADTTLRVRQVSTIVSPRSH